MDCSFIDDDILNNRTPLSENSRGTDRVTYVMKTTSDITVGTQPPYKFQYVEREVPHLRTETMVEQDGKGWIDYIAKSDGTPILGEIKYNGDQNPFYAFIQLITYLSEMATENQIERANNHKLFGDGVEDIESFDLHIFLANFNDRGEKGKLIDLTFKLAKGFMKRLEEYPELSQMIRNILCISATINETEPSFTELKCLWNI